jgi:hypothetical protein
VEVERHTYRSGNFVMLDDLDLVFILNWIVFVHLAERALGDLYNTTAKEKSTIVHKEK